MPRAVLACLLVGLAGAASAQPIFGVLRTLEAKTAEADLIVRGSVVVAPQPALATWGGRQATIVPVDVLKGDSPLTPIVVPLFETAPRLDGLKDGLIFLKRPALNEGHVREIHDAFPHRYVFFDFIPLEGPPPLAMSLTLERLSQPDDIIRRVTQAVHDSRLPASPRTWNFLLPPPPGPLPPYRVGSGEVMIVVPIDYRLEAQARGWMASSSGPLRKIGVRAISFFPNSRHIAPVKARLRDRYVIRAQTPSGEVRIRPVREAAKDTLGLWDVPWEPVRPASMAAAREMVFVPGGAFLIGQSRETYMAEGERMVNVEGFWIGKTPVTVAQYRAFCRATGFAYDWAAHRPRYGYRDDHPMVNVNWFEARAFCVWAGGDLPTEAQWEKAARGRDGRRLPWGNRYEPSYLHGDRNRFTSWRETSPVGMYRKGASPYGALDMMGNVSEWCRDGDDPQRSTRGVGYEHSGDLLEPLHVANRRTMHADGRISTHGFRVAASTRRSLPSR